MKKKIGIFIFIVICSTVMLSDWIERIYIGRLAGLPGRYNSYVGIQKEQKDSIDMLVLGDSESMTSISPMELWKSTGITSYICGQSGQRISESYYMLKHALDYQSPQVVLLETNMLFREICPTSFLLFLNMPTAPEALGSGRHMFFILII